MRYLLTVPLVPTPQGVGLDAAPAPRAGTASRSDAAIVPPALTSHMYVNGFATTVQQESISQK